MAGSSLFALLDDIATLLDDVSVMTKIAAKKTAGVLGDDLALNAQQVSGVLELHENYRLFGLSQKVRCATRSYWFLWPCYLVQ